jgi:hypothetical protein
MTTFLQQGPIGQGKATIALAANVAVKWDASNPGNVVVCGAGDIPIGYTMDAYAAGVTASFYRAGSGHEMYVSGSGISAGDYVKCGAAGALVQEGTPTTPTALTVGQAKTASDSANNILLSSTR